MQLRGDPCGIFCVILVYSSMAHADYAFTVWMVLPTFGESIWGGIHLAIFNLLLLLVVAAHARTMLADPGIVPINISGEMGRRPQVAFSADEDSASDNDVFLPPNRTEFVGEDWSVCTRCESFRPPRAHHCRVCRRCIRRMDHHCPWVNNCVGEFNQKYFLQFLLYVALASVYSVIVVILSWVWDKNHGHSVPRGGKEMTQHQHKVLHTIFLCVEAALFGMFVCAVSCDQLQAILNDETAVEAAVARRALHSSRRHSPPRSRFHSLRDVFGPGPSWTWLLPCTIQRGKRDLVRFPVYYQV